ncbi:MAG: TIGR03668 family PPOX class F420-dependent oxidoreductase [Candidatus Limnocylindrales bacterium]
MALLTPAQRALLATARTATLATIDPDGLPRLVPICFVLSPDAPLIHTPLDEKPKRSADVRDLARVRDLVARPAVALIVERWSEDWSQLAWLRCAGRAAILDPVADAVVVRAVARALRAKYPQYREHDLDARPLIRIGIERVVGWTAGGSEPAEVVSPSR